MLRESVFPDAQLRLLVLMSSAVKGCTAESYRG